MFCFNILEYAKRCDVVFMRDMASPFIKNSDIKDITDGCTIYCWSTMLNNLFSYLKTTNIKDIILLSGDNDHSANPNGCVTSFPHENYISAYISSAPKNIKKWHAQNAQVVNDFMVPLPIGLTPPWIENRVYDIEGIKSNTTTTDRSDLLYTNFGISTNPVQRKEIQDIVNKNFNSKNSFGNNNQYYKDLQKYKYTLCPPGNGKDTHRTWESIYFGAIPIVEDNPMNRYFANFFPMMVVERWCEITSNFLLDNYDSIKNKFENKDLLDTDNWFKCQKIKL